MTSLTGLYERLPRLAASPHQITSEPSEDYNCVAWVFRDFARYYAPGYYWPRDVAPPVGDDDVDAYMSLFASRGYTECNFGELEPGFLKVAIYAKDGSFHHVAKQLPSGEWSSKIGEAHDLRHERLDALEGSSVYFDEAVPSRFMKRPYDPQSESFALELTGLI